MPITIRNAKIDINTLKNHLLFYKLSNYIA